jgi:integrase
MGIAWLLDEFSAVFITSTGLSRLQREFLPRTGSELAAAPFGPARSWARRVFAEDRVPGKVVAQLMGHANVDTTLNVYTQVLDGSVRDAVEKVGSELFTIVHKSVKPEGAGGR